jgi:hypothetical protein
MTPYSRRTLADACGILPRQVDRHVRRNTLRLAEAKHRVAGLGVLFHAAKAERFVLAMRAKNSAKGEVRS